MWGYDTLEQCIVFQMNRALLEFTMYTGQFKRILVYNPTCVRPWKPSLEKKKKERKKKQNKIGFMKMKYIHIILDSDRLKQESNGVQN